MSQFLKASRPQWRSLSLDSALGGESGELWTSRPGDLVASFFAKAGAPSSPFRQLWTGPGHLFYFLSNDLI